MPFTSIASPALPSVALVGIDTLVEESCASDLSALSFKAPYSTADYGYLVESLEIVLTSLLLLFSFASNNVCTNLEDG